MNITVNGKSYDLREWAFDLVVTSAAYVGASRLFMTADTPIVEQPLSFLLVLGSTALAFKLTRQIKTFK